MLSEARKQIFEDAFFLDAYDAVMMASTHYRAISNVHKQFLRDCPHIVDLGCGTGNLTIEFLKMNKRVIGVDASQAALSALKSKIKSKSIGGELETICGDVTDLTTIPDCSVSGASSMIVAHLVSNFEEHISEAHRVLVHGGRFIITARTYPFDEKSVIEIVRRSVANSQVTEGDYELVHDNLLSTARLRSSSLLTLDYIRSVLLKTGFTSFSEHQNQSNNAMATISALKCS